MKLAAPPRTQGKPRKLILARAPSRDNAHTPPPSQRTSLHLIHHLKALGNRHISVGAVETARTPCALDARRLPTGVRAGTQIAFLTFRQSLHTVPFATHSRPHPPEPQTSTKGARDTWDGTTHAGDARSASAAAPRARMHPATRALRCTRRRAQNRFLDFREQALWRTAEHSAS